MSQEREFKPGRLDSAGKTPFLQTVRKCGPALGWIVEEQLLIWSCLRSDFDEYTRNNTQSWPYCFCSAMCLSMLELNLVV